MDTEIWSRLNVDAAAVLPSLLEAATKRGKSPYATFEKGFFSKLVPNVRKLGLLEANDGYLRQLWGEAGLLRYEFADDTLENYDSYDEVARDRAGLSVA